MSKTKPLWALADALEAQRVLERRQGVLRAILTPPGARQPFTTTATHPRFGAYGTINGSRLNQRTWDAIQIAGFLSGWGPVVITQGGLNNGAVAASGGTHDALDVADISVKDKNGRVRPIEDQKRLVYWLALCGIEGMIRGTNADDIADGMVSHVHCVAFGAQHATQSAKDSIYSKVFGTLYGGAGLGGARWARWFGPKMPKRCEWSESKYNPKNGWLPA